MTHNEQTDRYEGRHSEDSTRQRASGSPRDIVTGYDPSEKTIILRSRGQTELDRRQSTVATHYYDSLQWMTTALQKDGESGRSIRHTPTNLTVLKVGQVACGFAIELAYKALLYSQGKSHSKAIENHDAFRLHQMVDEPDRTAIESVCEELLKDDSSELAPHSATELIKYVSDHYTNPDVKYWGRRAIAHGGAVIPGMPTKKEEYFGSITAIQKIHHKILDMARRRTWPYNWQEFQVDASQDAVGQYNSLVAYRSDADDPLPDEIFDRMITEQIAFCLASIGIEVSVES